MQVYFGDEIRGVENNAGINRKENFCFNCVLIENGLIMCKFIYKSLPMTKKAYLVFLGIVLSSTSFAQLLITAPAFPKDTSGISITVDCARGNQGLFNYSNTGDVYVHVGVITNLSASAADWKYVKFTWGSTDGAARATFLGNNKYQYIINNIRSFFGVPVSEKSKKYPFFSAMEPELRSNVMLMRVICIFPYTVLNWLVNLYFLLLNLSMFLPRSPLQKALATLSALPGSVITQQI